ncbi:tetratricopeptide repeat-containing sensor histidine kinase [Flavobacterium sp. GCM10023249]|uniref:tetratricopeptide repeat-containing sensor histidine kinase n=1 Tax=unclassified Flavobacterium TaxID=196869 RepID=UPI00361E37E3
MKHIAFLLVSLFIYFNSYSITVVDQFKKVDYNKKAFFYRSLRNEDKLQHNLFFESYFTNEINRNSVTKHNKDFTFCLASIYQIQNKHIKAIETFNLLLKHHKTELKPRDLTDIYVGLQESYLQLNLYSKVFEINNIIESLIKKGYDFPLWSYNIKSRLFYQLREYKKAIVQLEKEIHFLQSTKKRDSLIIPSAYNDLGLFYYYDKNYSKALINYNKALQIASISLKNNPKTQTLLSSVVHINIAKLYISLEKYKTAKSIIEEKVFPLKETIDKETLLEAKLNYTRALLGNKQLKEASERIKELDRLIQSKSSKYLLGYLNVKLNYHKLTGQYAIASRVQDSIISLNNEYLENLNKKIRESSELNYLYSEKEKDETENTRKIRAFEKKIFLIVIVTLLIILSIGSYSILINRKKRLQIQAMNLSIKESLLEKEYLLKEIHHRVKNNLQIVSGIIELQKLNIADDSVKVILEDGQARIKSIALVHQILYQSNNFDKINFKTFLNELLEAIRVSYQSKHDSLLFQKEIDDIELNLNTSISLSLIINEIITNSIKHATIEKAKKVIFIRFLKKDNVFELFIKDNGSGFSTNVLDNKSNSVGIDLIKGLTKQIDGSVRFSNNNGAQVLITFQETKNNHQK